MGMPGDRSRWSTSSSTSTARQWTTRATRSTSDPTVYADLPFYRTAGAQSDNFGPSSSRRATTSAWATTATTPTIRGSGVRCRAHLIKGRALFIYWSYGGKTSAASGGEPGRRSRTSVKTALGFFSEDPLGPDVPPDPVGPARPPGMYMHEKSLLREYLEALLIAIIFATFARTWWCRRSRSPRARWRRTC